MKLWGFLALSTVLAAQAGLAQQAGGYFELGTLTELDTVVLGSEGRAAKGTVTRVDAADIRKNNAWSLDEALNRVPGVTSGQGANWRNEREVMVRGFDRYQVPLSIDGIRVYAPYDNRLDHGRFMAPDLAGIEVQKGYVSVLNGPGAMGGAINLVTRKPVKPWEGEARIGVEIGNTGDVAAKTALVSIGTKQEHFYAQASFSQRDRDGFYLSKDFVPVNPALQDHGLRNGSWSNDKRYNVKFGYTPNATDEYAISYTRQTGTKSGLYSTVSQSGQNADWPVWDVSSLAFYSNTEFQNGLKLKTRLYHNEFDNVLTFYARGANNLPWLPGAQVDNNSVYDDYSQGGSVELSGALGEGRELAAAFHFRRDNHRNHEVTNPYTNPQANQVVRRSDETLSAALEYRHQVNERLRLVAGLSYERSSVRIAERVVNGQLEAWPNGSTDAVNWQIAGYWTAPAGGEFHASLSDRTRFPSLWERYSTRMGRGIENPELGPERALNLELGYKGDLGPVAIETAVFHSRIKDMILTVPTLQTNGTYLNQNRNVGTGRASGFEISASSQISDRLALGGNYTLLHRKVKDPQNTGARPLNTPQHSAGLWLDWQAMDNLTISPMVELASARWVDGGTSNPFARISGYGLAHVNVDWQVNDTTSVAFGVRNILDRNYEVSAGYPAAGRSFYLNAGITF